MESYGSYCDDFFVNLSLGTEMELPQDRETVLSYLERIQKRYPTMRNFYAREKGELVLEEDKEQGQYRWTTIEPRKITSGVVNPETVAAAMEQHRLILQIAPSYLSISPLDCEALDLMFGFDFTYRGNHNQVVAEALGLAPSLERLLDVPGASVVSYEPSLTLALEENCRTQCRLHLETRSNAYQMKTGDFSEDQISVYFTVRKYGSLEPGSNYGDTLDQMLKTCTEMVDSYVIQQVLAPLARAIALR